MPNGAWFLPAAPCPELLPKHSLRFVAPAGIEPAAEACPSLMGKALSGKCVSSRSRAGIEPTPSECRTPLLPGETISIVFRTWRLRLEQRTLSGTLCLQQPDAAESLIGWIRTTSSDYESAVLPPVSQGATRLTAALRVRLGIAPRPRPHPA